MKNYRSAEWKQFRAEVVRLDGNACVRCSSRSDLQVHHKKYIAGRNPWDYRHDQCETLCRACHAREHGIIPPNTGWDVIGIDDLGDLCGTCDYCGTDIRHVFMVSHPKWATMEVGEICCDKLTCTEIATSHMKTRRNYAARCKRFVSSPRWSGELRGEAHIIHFGAKIAVVADDSTFRIEVNGRRGKLEFPSAIDARSKIFDLLENKELIDFLGKQKAAISRKWAIGHRAPQRL